MTVRELREKYLRFFESKGHSVFPSGSLVPVDVTGRLDESLLFNGAGMIQFKPYFRGVAKPTNLRLTTAQKCVRTGDIDEVGNLSHLTFFEMMGNFSFGDYFKREAIAYSWEFLTSPEWLGLDPNRLSFTVFEDDDEAYDCWTEHFATVGIDAQYRVFRLGEETNYWPAGAFSKGPPGPCGPNSEMFYWVSDSPPPGARYEREEEGVGGGGLRSSDSQNPDRLPGDDGAGGGGPRSSDSQNPDRLQGEEGVGGGGPRSSDSQNPDRVPGDDGAGGGGLRSSDSQNPDRVPSDDGAGRGGPRYSREDWLRDDAAKNWLEIWNDVFIQFEWQGQLKNPDRPSDGFEKTGMPNLPFRSIDTGMGLERTAAVLGGFRSVYDTDAFQPIITKIMAIGKNSPLHRNGGGAGGGGREPEVGSSATDAKDSTPATGGGREPEVDSSANVYAYGQNDAKDTAVRIIADHIRTACFCIADGVLPGNSGRGYVLRRLIRRAVLKGQRVLGFEEPFFHLVYEGVVESMGDHYRELVERRDVIVETLKGEESQFRRTLEEGLSQFFSFLVSAYWDQLSKAYPDTNFASVNQVRAYLRQQFDDGKLRFDEHLQLAPFPGELAFKLYDTYGFPLEVTKELAAEAGVQVDEEGYEEALKEAQERSRGGTERESVYGGVQVTIVTQIMGVDEAKPTATQFVGYDRTESQTQVIGAIHIPGERPSPTQEHWPLAIALTETPFYAESGGQVGDTGLLVGSGFEGRVTDVIKQDGVFIHEVEPIKMPFDDPMKLTGIVVEAEVDRNRRARITRNHTATHLLHAALRQVLGKHVTQAGSYVGPDRLRFDFTHGAAMTEAQRLEVERIVNEKSLENLPVVIYQDLPIVEAKAMGAMALFGEKYGNTVRMVQVGPEIPSEKSFSRELCGGIHVRTTAEIGLFKIVHEASAASGVRRIEAITGEGAYEWVLEQMSHLHEAAEKLKSNPKDLLQSIDKHLEAQRDLKQKLEKARSQGAVQAESTTIDVEGVELAITNLGVGEAQEASQAADRLVEGKPLRVAVVAVAQEAKAMFVAKAGPDAVKKGAHAGNLVKELARITGGGGGGRPDFATAGGKDASKIAEALAAVEGVLRASVK